MYWVEVWPGEPLSLYTETFWKNKGDNKTPV